MEEGSRFLEARVKAVQTVDAGWFIGLAEEGACVADFMADDSREFVQILDEQERPKINEDMPVGDRERIHRTVSYDMDFESVYRILDTIGHAVCKHLDRPGNLLVMDDEEDMRRTTGDMLERMGYDAKRSRSSSSGRCTFLAILGRQSRDW
jgi:hypothetical protein